MLAAVLWAVLAQEASPTLEEILAAAPSGGGLCVLVGAGDGRLAVELARKGRLLVHVLDVDAAVERVREMAGSSGLAGQVTAERWTSGRLPYVDNLANLLVSRASGLSDKEALRVVAPGGVAFLGGIAKKKPRPATLGDWTHERGGPDRNAVSPDRHVSIPQGIQWLSGERGSGKSFLSAHGRNFYGNVVARDAFNGLPLWRANVRPLAAAGDRLYGLAGSSLVALDAASGKTILRYDEAGAPVEVLLDKDALLVTTDRSVRALDAQTGKLLWSHDASSPRALVLADGRATFVEGAARKGEKLSLRAIDAATGTPAWRSEAPPLSSLELSSMAQAGVVLLETSTLADNGNGCALHAFSARDGRKLWDFPFVPSMTHRKVARAFFTEGLFWAGTKDGLVGLDPQTGKAAKRHPVPSFGRGHCFAPVVAGSFYIHGECDFTDLRSGAHYYSRIQKGACGIAFTPANGLLYTFPSACICFPMLRGTNALSSAPDPRALQISKFPGGASTPLLLPAPADPAPRLDRASLRPSTPSGAEAPKPLPPSSPRDEWPAYRNDPWRSGSTETKVPARLTVLWEAKIADRRAGPYAAEWTLHPSARGPLTPPVAAAGRVVAAVPEAHQVLALDADTGRVAWSFTANGRVDTPPTLLRGRCFFGTAAGWVYALSLATGEQLWRVRVAPADERIVAYGQVESLWPAPGSVLADGDTLYVAAGRHAHADGGLFVTALDPSSGAVRWQRQLQELGISRWYARQGNGYDPFDLLVKDGDFVSLSRWRLDPRSGAVTLEAHMGHYRARRTGLWAPRGFWSYAAPSYRSPERKLEAKPLLAFDDHRLFGAADHVFRAAPETGAKPPPPEDLGTEEDEGPRKGASRDKGPLWTAKVSDATALVLAGDHLFVAAKGEILTLSAADGKTAHSANVGAPAVWDGMAAAWERLYVSTASGKVVCLKGLRP